MLQNSPNVLRTQRTLMIILILDWLKIKIPLLAGLAKHNQIPIEQIKSGQHDVELENIGDGICHDFLNRPECGFDGGDCCLKDLITFEESDVHKLKTCFGCMCYNSDTLTENCPGKKQYIGRFLA